MMNGQAMNELYRKRVLLYVKQVSYDMCAELAQFKRPSLLIKSNSRLNNFKRLVLSETDLTLSIYMKMLSVIHSLVENNQFALKRDIYYQFKHLLKNELHLDKILNDLAQTIDVPRTCLHIMASSKGLIAGNLDILMLDGQIITARETRHGVPTPTRISEIVEIKFDACFVLIVEKDCTFQRLLDDGFLNKYRAVLITGKGMPDLATRQFLNLMYKQLPRLKFYCLTDANPYGIQIMLVYKYGSEVMYHDSHNLNLPTLRWIGLDLLDLSQLGLMNKQDLLLDMSRCDTRLAKSLIKKLTPLQEFKLIEQLEAMTKLNKKAEIQLLQHLHRSFLCNVYLRAKLCY